MLLSVPSSSWISLTWMKGKLLFITWCDTIGTCAPISHNIFTGFVIQQTFHWTFSYHKSCNVNLLFRVNMADKHNLISALPRSFPVQYFFWLRSCIVLHNTWYAGQCSFWQRVEQYRTDLYPGQCLNNPCNPHLPHPLHGCDHICSDWSMVCPVVADLVGFPSFSVQVQRSIPVRNDQHSHIWNNGHISPLSHSDKLHTSWASHPGDGALLESILKNQWIPTGMQSKLAMLLLHSSDPLLNFGSAFILSLFALSFPGVVTWR